jgi:hypothetical protein
MIAASTPPSGWACFLLALLFVGGPIASWWFMYRAEWRHTPTDAERGFTPFATFRTGMMVSTARSWQHLFARVSWSYPLVRVSTYQGFVAVVPAFATFFGQRPFCLRTEDRIRLEPGRWLWTRGLWIRHTRSDAPSLVFIAARPRERQALVDALRLSVHARIEHEQRRGERSP